jgi:hypothetical protein
MTRAGLALVLAGVSFAAVADAPAALHVVVHFNFITQQTNDWTSSGAFVDHGVIGLDENLEVFRGRSYTSHVVNAQVHGPIVADDGSKIYWQFNKQIAIATPTEWITQGEWHITGGTGRYAGLKGQGLLEGTMNIETGDITDVFTGSVQMPSP